MNDSTINRYSILIFIFLAFAISWGTLLITSDMGSTIAKFGPSLAGVITIALVGGRLGILQLLKRLATWRVNVVWYGVALLGPSVIWLLALWIGYVTDGVLPEPDLTKLSAFIPLFLTALFLGGGFGEELGWRGFMLPKLQERLSPITSSLVIGLIWGAWHAPVFLFAGAERSGGLVSFVLFTILVICLSVIFTWVFNNSKEGLIIPLLLHASLNATENAFEQIFPAMQDSSGYTFIYGGLILLLALILILFRRRARLAASP